MGSGENKTIEKLKQFLGINKFESELALIDPKDKASDEKDKKIERFCEELKKCIQNI